MSPRICICCGEPMSKNGNALSRNPNMCASCSSMADGMNDSNLPEPEEMTRRRWVSIEAEEPVSQSTKEA